MFFTLNLTYLSIKTPPLQEMNQTLEHKLIQIIKNDEWMLTVLKTVSDLNLNDCWIGAGFVRNKIWDEKHQKPRTVLNDIDVIYYNQNNISKTYDITLENCLKKKDSNLNWSVKNQARMHVRNKHKQYINCNDAISFWPETATAIAVRLNSENKIEYIAPYGLDDLFNLLVIPTPNFNLSVYKTRIENKNWVAKWPNLKINTNYKITN